jgi:hypothetical protein
MKRLMTLISLAVLALSLAACSAAAISPVGAVEPDTYQSKVLTTDYEGAASVRNQLLLGTLALDGTGLAITAEQAAQLLPLWQALRGTSKTGGSSQQEINALLSQIEGVMSAEQLAAIKEMKLNTTSVQEWAKANGVTLGSNGGQSGMGLSPEARATRQAQEGRTPGSAGGAMTALMDAMIKYLEGIKS